MTPYQLHLEGINFALQSFNHSTLSMDNIHIDTTPLVTIEVPRITFIPCAALKRGLSVVNSLELTLDHCKELYRQTIQIVGQHLAASCNQCIV